MIKKRIPDRFDLSEVYKVIEDYCKTNSLKPQIYCRSDRIVEIDGLTTAQLLEIKSLIQDLEQIGDLF